jgi:hypothetical protein
MKPFSLSAFLTITPYQLRVLYLTQRHNRGRLRLRLRRLRHRARLQTQPPAPPAQQGPCQQIMDACRQAGFMQGGAKTGAGLQVDCVRPIMQGGTFSGQSFQSLTAG